MSNRGIAKLKSLTLSFCDFGGSSKGVRELLKNESIYDLVNKNENVQFKFSLRRGRHPFVEAEFINGFSKSIGIKNIDAKTIQQHIQQLTTEVGRKPLEHNGYKVTSFNKSIQGGWKPNMFSNINVHKMQHFIPLPAFNPEEVLKEKGILRKSKPKEDKHISNAYTAKYKEKDFFD